MDNLEIKALAYVLAKKLKETHHQMSAYRHVIDLVRGSGFPDVDGWVEIALQAPDIQAETDSVFESLDERLPPIPEIDLDQAFRLWLEQWKSDGKEPN
jgi:hypothetical protein